jgi:hypothetical protein
MSKEHPILFSTPMIQALLEGRKSMTRRIIKPQPEYYEIEDKKMVRYETKKSYMQIQIDNLADEFLGIPCPYGKIGDVLWVRETFTIMEPEHCASMSERFVYKADMKHPDSEEMRQEYIKSGYPYQWKPSIFMPRAACRILLEITDIKVERLQDINFQDALNEGVHRESDASGQGWFDNYQFLDSKFNQHNVDTHAMFKDPVRSFKTLWQSINGEESWDKNPWVWAIAFQSH